MKEITKDWIKYAEDDISMSYAADSIGILSQVCFHAQQAAEKYLKAILIENAIEFKLVHDLMYLLKQANIEYTSDIALYCDTLTQYAIIAKYPGFDVNKDILDEALLTMTKLVNFCKLNLQPN